MLSVLLFVEETLSSGVFNKFVGLVFLIRS